ncbi:periplasmic glucan biosynthesis protein, MdoG [Leptospira ryugenii]|uniref:Glucans biosynthesis protein G n=1 Tax=Leptospira ryugenii TaxID=1917863 RepID=A0A2P2DV91_9LEPT|nr:glucan biosynthesis protein [Leptospira ryugenii]GBF48556.1 periplasmic glucan biosynthesis protein, MdoG [Leptospira ryugenii]
MGLINLILGAFAAFLIATGITKDPNAEKEKGNVSLQVPHEVVRPKLDFNSLKSKAKKLQETAFVELKAHSSKELAALPYDRYKNIRFLTEKSIWRKEGSNFQIQFLPPGHLYNQSIYINELIEDSYQGIPFSADYFDWTDVGSVKFGPEFGHSGFKIHFPINTEEHTDEFVVFQGSSYFRMVSKNQVYGLSARGLAINTGMPNVAEEFPVFREFWLKKPSPSDPKMIVYALLDSRSATGAYQFEIFPGEVTKCTVTAEIYLRKPVEKLGLAPLTSMFWYGENSSIPQGQVYPEVHDSDGLQILTSNGELLWRPIDNPKRPHIHSFELENPKGYGLIQRDKEFANYEDVHMKYHLRPSAWIEPSSGFQKGNLQLYRFPTKQDSDDNVTLLWVPNETPDPGQPLNLEYTIYWNSSLPKKLAYVHATRINALKEGEKLYLIDFKGEIIKSLVESGQNPIPVVESWNEPWEPSNVSVVWIPESEKLRLSFQLPTKLGSKGTELKAYLKNKDDTISEVWTISYEPSFQ